MAARLCSGVAGQRCDLTGVFPPIVTPFRSDESVAYSELQRNVARWSEQPLAGFLVHGSNGEFVYQSPAERLAVLAAVRESCPGDKLLLAGTGAESTLETIRQTEDMAAAGASAAVVVTPCYYKGRMSGASLEAHYRAVADSSPIPVVLYSVPANTGLDLPVEVAVRLASHPNIAVSEAASLQPVVRTVHCRE